MKPRMPVLVSSPSPAMIDVRIGIIGKHTWRKREQQAESRKNRPAMTHQMLPSDNQLREAACSLKGASGVSRARNARTYRSIVASGRLTVSTAIVCGM